MSEHLILELALLGTVIGACQWAAWWAKLPAILPLLISGICLGPITGLLDPEALMGSFLFPFISLSVAVILFEGALTLRFDQIRGLEKVVRNLVTSGIFVTWIIIAVSTRFILDFSWELSLLFGAIAVVTGPTVVIPMLRTVRPNATISNILRWEGIVIDPIGALLAVLVFEFILSSGGAMRPESSLTLTFIVFIKTVLGGVIMGVSLGYTLGSALLRHLIPEYLQSVITLLTVLLCFALSNQIQEESGLLAVTVMGIWMANMKGVAIDDILDFKENLSVLLLSALFIILAAKIQFDQFTQLGIGALWIFLIIQFVARPIKILVSTIGSTLSVREKVLLGWIAPRGIVAAAVSAIFAIKLIHAGYEQAELLVPLAFIVIIGTVSLQSATSRVLAVKLGVAEPDPKGFLLIGANNIARAIGSALVSQGFRVLLTDSNWENIKIARMENLPTYHGNAVSQHADRHLDLVGIGKMLALSDDRELNALAAMSYKNEFGRNNVYTLSYHKEGDPSKHSVAPTRGGVMLFGKEITFSKMDAIIGDGAEIKSSKLTESFTFDDYLADRTSAILIFAIDPKGRIQMFVENGEMKPTTGWIVASLVGKNKTIN